MSSILVVDDEKMIREALEDFLLTSGYMVCTACSGEEALAFIRQETPDVVLLDICMPGMDGMELLKKIRGMNEETSVIMLTAVMNIETAVEAMKMGAYDYVTKPVDLWQLEASIQRAIERGRLTRTATEYHKNLESEVKERTAELKNALRDAQEAHLDTIYRLSLAAEFRNHETASHLRRISKFSAVTARALGLNEGEVKTIRVASIMHDIGKIGVPDSILLKPGKLNEEEFNEIKKHTIMGGEILSGSDADFLRMAEAIALTHHEKYDGTGYPKGLKGDSIPIAGRIVAVADVFDALTTRRVYKPSFPDAVAYRVIREESGKHFDPKVVEAFFSDIRTIEEVKASYQPVGSLEGLLRFFSVIRRTPVYDSNV